MTGSLKCQVCLSVHNLFTCLVIYVYTVPGTRLLHLVQYLLGPLFPSRVRGAPPRSDTCPDSTSCTESQVRDLGLKTEV